MNSLNHFVTRYFGQREMPVENWNGYVDINPPKVCLNKLFHKLCLVDGVVLEYIEWKVYLTEGNNFDPIEIICVGE